MNNQQNIVEIVYAAKNDVQKADELIRSYIPFIRSETSKFLSRFCTQDDDEFSIAMIAFNEAILSYDESRGSFISYASILIRNRLIDYQRKESKHNGQISLYTPTNEDGATIADDIAEESDRFEDYSNSQATKEEILELSRVMAEFDINFSDVADNCPKQERTLTACLKAIKYAQENTDLLDILLKTKKLPMAQLVKGSKVERKTLERHRKYILAMLLILTNGYEIIRGHLRRIINSKGDF